MCAKRLSACAESKGGVLITLAGALVLWVTGERYQATGIFGNFVQKAARVCTCVRGISR